MLSVDRTRSLGTSAQTSEMRVCVRTRVRAYFGIAVERHGHRGQMIFWLCHKNVHSFVTNQFFSAAYKFIYFQGL